jgi:hypothetical protein
MTQLAAASNPLARRYPAVLPAACAALGRVAPRIRVKLRVSGCPDQLIGLISGVMTGVTAGAVGFIGAEELSPIPPIEAAGLRFAAFFFAVFFFAALRAGFFFAAFLVAFFFDDFFFDAFFFATRFLEDFFFAVFLVDFFFAAFFFAAISSSFRVGQVV